MKKEKAKKLANLIFNKIHGYLEPKFSENGKTLNKEKAKALTMFCVQQMIKESTGLTGKADSYFEELVKEIKLI